MMKFLPDVQMNTTKVYPLGYSPKVPEPSFLMMHELMTP